MSRPAVQEPASCPHAEKRTEGAAYCGLAKIWTNCLQTGGCHVDGDGRFLEPDNSEEAMAERRERR